MINEEGYRVLRLSRDNIGDLAKLYSGVYGSALQPEEYFAKKYNTAYTGAEYVGFIAYSKDHQPVAYYGVIPCFIQYETGIMLAAQSADTMTHPLYRYKGIFVQLSNLTFDLCRQLGIRLLFGFPNQHSYHGAVNKLGWKITETMDCFIIPVRGLPIEGITSRLKFLKKLYARYKQFILGKYTIAEKGVLNSVVVDGFAGVLRNEAYLDYKEGHGARVIAIGGSKAWISTCHGLMVGDMEGVDERNLLAFMNKLKRIARKLGVAVLQFHCSPGTRFHALLAGQYKATPSYPVLFQDFGSVVPPEQIKFTFADIDVF